MRSTRLDALFLAAATALSCAWYVPRLRFYSDDWAFLGRYATAGDQSVAALFAASYSSHHAMRPVQLWLCAALYRTFGIEPLGYHLFNTAILLSLPVLVYLILRELERSRSIALSAALVYALLPSYSTDRFWFGSTAIRRSRRTSSRPGSRSPTRASRRRFTTRRGGIRTAIACWCSWRGAGR